MELLHEILRAIFGLILVYFRVLHALIEETYKYFVPPPSKSVKGEIVLITGTGHGIGKELALLYASEGATVIGWDINEKNNEKTISEINRLGYPKAYAYKCDVSNREDVFEVAKKVQKDVGSVTILINNAGIMPTHRFLEQTHKEIEKTFAINVYAHFWTLQAFLPEMIKSNHGHVVALASIAGLAGIENVVPYCASKYAVCGLMESLREEFRIIYNNNKLKFTIICPGMVDTNLCKKPIIKFGNLMKLLSPKYVARKILEAQKTNRKLVTVPGYYLHICKFTRLLPYQCHCYIKDFMGFSLESDL